MVRISDNTNWYNSNQKEMRINIQARDSKNVETTKIIHGMYTPLNKVYTKTRRISRTTTTTFMKK